MTLDSRKKIKPFNNRSTLPLKRLQQSANSPGKADNAGRRNVFGRPVQTGLDPSFRDRDLVRNRTKTGRRLQSTRKYRRSGEGPGALPEDMACSHQSTGTKTFFSSSFKKMISVNNSHLCVVCRYVIES